jgi:hypothetical protein
MNTLSVDISPMPGSSVLVYNLFQGERTIKIRDRFLGHTRIELRLSPVIKNHLIICTKGYGFVIRFYCLFEVALLESEVPS